MKRLILLLAALVILHSGIYPDVLINQTITLSSTPARVSTISALASSIMIQMQPGSTSTGYVLYANPAIACSTSNVNQIAGTLAPANSTTNPGGVYRYPTVEPTGGQVIDASFFCVSGTSPDTVIVSYSKR